MVTAKHDFREDKYLGCSSKKTGSSRELLKFSRLFHCGSMGSQSLRVLHPSEKYGLGAFSLLAFGPLSRPSCFFYSSPQHRNWYLPSLCLKGPNLHSSHDSLSFFIGWVLRSQPLLMISSFLRRPMLLGFWFSQDLF